MRIRNLIFLTVAMLLFGALTLAIAPLQSQAQGQNLLANPGFEGGYYNQDDIPEIAVPLGWKMHWLDNVTFPGSNGLAYRPETVVWNKGDAPVWEQDVFWRDGIFNLKIFKGGSPVYAALSQDIALQKGARYRFTAPVFVDIVSTYNDDGKVAPSDPSWGGVRLGASQQGSGWNAGAINFSGWFNSGNTPGFYLNMIDYRYEFTATESNMTVWVEMFGTQPIPNNGFFIDGLSLELLSPPPTKVWPTKTPTPVPPTETPEPTVEEEEIPTAIPTLTPYPTITPTPLPTGPWFTPVPEVVEEEVAAPAAGPVAAVQVANVSATTDNYVEDGVTYATVGTYDSVWSVAAKNGLTLEEILELNNLPESEVIFVKAGDSLIVGYSEEEPAVEEEPAAEDAEGEESMAESSEEGEAVAAEESSENSAETTTTTDTNQVAIDVQGEEISDEVEEVTITEAASPTSELCLKAYSDDNKNAQYDEGEALLSNIAFTVLRGDDVISNYISDGQTDTYCIKGLPAGTYNITRSKLPNEVLTTGGEVSIPLAEGQSVDALFGSYMEDEPSAETEAVAATSADGDTVTGSSSGDVANQQSVAEETDPTTGILIAVVAAAALLLIAVVVILFSRRKN